MTAGTVFDRIRTPLTQWFAAAWHVCSTKNGASALGLQKLLGLGSYEHQGAVQPVQLDYYLDEFTFRFNRRDSRAARAAALPAAPPGGTQRPPTVRGHRRRGGQRRVGADGR